MIETHSLKLNNTDFNYDKTDGFEMAIEKNWHVIDPVDVLNNVDMYDSNLNKLYNDDRYAIRIFYKLVLPLCYFSDSGIINNPLLNSDNKFIFDNGLAIGNPTINTNLGGNEYGYRGLIISDEVYKNNKNYSIPDEWDINKTYTKKEAFAEGTSISHLNIDEIGGEQYTQLQSTLFSSYPNVDRTIPFLFSSGNNLGGISSINKNDTTVAYTVTTEGNSINVPNGVETTDKKLMPLLFKPFGMSWLSDDANPSVVGWVYCVLGVKQIMSENTYIVKFIDYDGTVLKIEEVMEGTAATPPSDPYRDGYKFIGWKPNTYNDVLDNMNIYAQYEQVDISVHAFLNGDGDITLNRIPVIGSGSADVIVTFALDINTVTYTNIYITEFGSGAGSKTDVIIGHNTVSFVDDDISTHDFYAIQIFNDGSRVGTEAWNLGVIPNKIKFTLSDGSEYEFNVVHE